MTRSDRACAVGLVLAAVAAGGVMMIETPAAVRALVVLGFIAIGPGLGFVGLLGITDWVQRLVLGIASSLAIDTVVAGISLYAGYWSPPVILLVLIAITLIGVAVQSPSPSSLIADGHNNAT